MFIDPEDNHKYEEAEQNRANDTQLETMFHIFAGLSLLGVYAYLSSTIIRDNNHPLSESFYLVTQYYQ
jgi:hypothetical protein